jgi:hypothetical protein
MEDRAKVADAAAQFCESVDIAKDQQEACRAEVSFALTELCQMGDPALTGAGP